MPRRGRDFARESPLIFPALLLNCRMGALRVSKNFPSHALPVFSIGGDMIAAHHLAQALRLAAAAMIAIALIIAAIASAAALPQKGPPFGSTESILHWINDYRHAPDPEGLPAVVRALSTMQAFKDAETS